MDEEALKSRLEALHADAFGWALGCCRRDPDAAREVLQMAYVKILEGRAQYNGHATFRTWLFAVVRNTAADHRRRSWLGALGLDRLHLFRRAPDPVPDPETSAITSDSARVLRRALERLPERQREVLHLVFYEGMTLDEAAGVLHVSPGTARIHYERGKRRLLDLLPRGMKP
jgi:RNA polymerase sigma-70 factor, ECF subfamily